MLELASFRKSKIRLEDYDYQKDISLRLEIAHLSPSERIVLEAILFSPLRISQKKLLEATEVTETVLLSSLKKWEKMGLLVLQDKEVVIDKQMRRFFDTQMAKYDEEFQPDLEFLQELLRKVPLHILPSWYALPRNSNHIFSSIVEKKLLTPALFQRHLLEIQGEEEPILVGIIEDLYNSPQLLLLASAICKKYDLSPEKFEEYALLLEFHFVGCLSYVKIENLWQEAIVPFREWKDYLLFLRHNIPLPLASPQKIQKFKKGEFAFIHDLSSTLSLLQKKNITNLSELALACKETDSSYFHRIIQRLYELNLAYPQNEVPHPTEEASFFLSLSLEKKALHLYRSPSPAFSSERLFREGKKTLTLILDQGWVLTEDFLSSAIVPLNEDKTISLKKVGKKWFYDIPPYTPEEKNFLHKFVTECLFESGVTDIGLWEGKECLQVTPFGKKIFSHE